MAAESMEPANNDLPKTTPHENPMPSGWESFYQNYRKPGYVPGYEIGHKLGGGVFGIVYKARKESIGKAYAIKFLKIDDPSVKAQVIRELEQVGLFAQVDHPNLVSIEDKGEVDGIPYIIMGYAGEDTLKDRLEEGELGEEEALRIFVQVVRGVQALHDHSLIHFDLKPANIFLKGDVARIGDYGLSKLICESRMSLSFGRGTPYYMAPEMLSRRGDHRSDIYSLGIILYECLSGSLPFTGENEWEVLKGHEEKPVPYPSSIPSSYRRILSSMLAKDPDERYQSLEEVLRDLRAPGRLGESIVLELGSANRSARRSPPRPSARKAPPVSPAVEAATPNSVGSPGTIPQAGAAAASAVPAETDMDFGPFGLLAGLLRALVIALLLPARVLGLSLGKGLQTLLRLPILLLSFLGKVSIVLLAGILIFLIVWGLLGSAV